MSDETVEKKSVHPEYAELLCDFMFKRLFGSEANKDVLMGFLNMILEDVQIKDVKFIPTEHFGKRAVFYTSFPINEQGRLAKEEYIREHQCKDDGEEFRWDFDLKPVMVVAILNFMFEHDKDWPKDRYHSSYRLREDRSGEEMTDVLRYVFLELGRFRKRIWELESTFDKWMYLLKHMPEMVGIPKIFQTPEFRRLFILAKIGKFTPEEMEEYENSLKNMNDFYNIIDSTEKRARDEGRLEGELRGLEKGREEGRVVGREEEKRNNALKLKQLGVAIETISQATGLSVEEIEVL